jgi:hypothetical protein
VVVYILTSKKVGTTEQPAVETPVPEVTTQEVPANGEPATVTDVKPMSVTPATN